MFKVLFTEAFDNPYKFKQTHKADDFSAFEFTTSEKLKYEVAFSVIFGYEVDTFTDINFEDENGGFEATGAGDAFRVFATVIAIILYNKKQLLDYDIKIAAETTSKGRVRLYKRIADIIKTKLNYKKVKTEKEEGVINYYIIKRK